MRSLIYFMKEAIKSLKRNGLMTIASISTVTLSLFMLGIFLCAVINLNNMASNLESQVQLNIYLKDDLTTPQIMELGKKLKTLPDLKQLTFVNKVEAMQRFKERLGDQQALVTALDGANPLPNSYELTFTHPDDVKKTAELVVHYPQVESVHYGKEVVEDLFKLAHIIRIGGVVLILFLAGATLFIISNTIRLTVFARRKEIAIMKYVGATNSFIRWPFLLEGVMIGCIGAGIATTLVWQLYAFIVHQVQMSLAFMPIVPMYPFLYELLGGLFVVGIIVGAIGSTISLKQYMKV